MVEFGIEINNSLKLSSLVAKFRGGTTLCIKRDADTAFLMALIINSQVWKRQLSVTVDAALQSWNRFSLF